MFRKSVPGPSLASNSIKQTLGILLVDCSSSMLTQLIAAGLSRSRPGSMRSQSQQQGLTRIEALQQAVVDLVAQLQADTVANHSLQLGLVEFGGNVRYMDFSPLSKIKVGEFTSDGGTPMGAATMTAIDKIEARSRKLNRQGVSLNRSVVVLFTDGEPTDEVSQAAQRAAKFSETQGSFISFGFDQTDRSRLKKLGFPNVFSIDGDFTKYFEIVSASLASASRGAQDPFDFASSSEDDDVSVSNSESVGE